ncbi:uncharacterized protein OCT59_023950 [Rhizophagus irregularis]|uniref:uncharacterized protein n=1 Tax=Rhizophagus irregularis TaxID=588596 RepID=UPI00331947F2|nr:hypothetical protein OCT59_023950 [Rhizophagus irregularis]
MTKQIIVSPNKERIQIFELIKTMIISITNIFLAFIEASPLFASATKFYYTTAIAHFLSTIATYPNLKKNYDCCSFKVPNENPEMNFSFKVHFFSEEILLTFLYSLFVQHLILDYVGPNNKNQKKFWDHLDSDMLKKFWDYLFIKMNLARIQIFIVDFNSAINGCECLL